MNWLGHCTNILRVTFERRFEMKNNLKFLFGLFVMVLFGALFGAKAISEDNEILVSENRFSA